MSEKPPKNNCILKNFKGKLNFSHSVLNAAKPSLMLPLLSPQWEKQKGNFHCLAHIEWNAYPVTVIKMQKFLFFFLLRFVRFSQWFGQSKCRTMIVRLDGYVQLVCSAVEIVLIFIAFTIKISMFSSLLMYRQHSFNGPFSFRRQCACTEKNI